MFISLTRWTVSTVAITKVTVKAETESHAKSGTFHADLTLISKSRMRIRSSRSAQTRSDPRTTSIIPRKETAEKDRKKTDSLPDSAQASSESKDETSDASSTFSRRGEARKEWRRTSKEKGMNTRWNTWKEKQSFLEGSLEAWVMVVMTEPERGGEGDGASFIISGEPAAVAHETVNDVVDVGNLEKVKNRFVY